MRRMARGPVATLTCDPALVREFRLYEYAPLVLVLDTEARRYPSVDGIADALGGTVTVTPVPIPYGGRELGLPVRGAAERGRVRSVPGPYPCDALRVASFPGCDSRWRQLPGGSPWLRVKAAAKAYGEV